MATLNWNGDAVQLQLTKAMHRAVHEVGTLIHMDAVNRTPLLEGSLRHSSQMHINGNTMTVGNEDGHIDELASSNPLVSEDEVTMMIGYNTPYAVVQHEELGYNHPVGEAKFLENAYLAVDVEQVLLDVVKDVMING